MKKLTAVLLAVVIACCLCACGKTKQAGTRTYTVETCENSETVNHWRTLCLVDADNYIVTVYVVDGQDPETVRADFYMAGKYTTNEDGTVTIAPGYGYAWVLNGEIPIEVPVSPDQNGDFDELYYAVMDGVFDTFKLNSDGTWTGIEE